MRRARRVFERLRRRRALRPGVTCQIAFLECEPGCERHAYCVALRAALGGDYAMAIPGALPGGRQPMRVVFEQSLRLTTEQLGWATHGDQRCRAGFAIGSLVTARRAYEQAGRLV